MSNKRTALLKMTDDVKKALQVPFKVRKDRKNMESWIIDVESNIANLEVDIEELKGNEDLQVDRILDKVDDLALAKRKLTQGEALLQELFEETWPETNAE